MCGISGVSGRNAAIKSLFLVLGQLERGTQGCGCAWIKKNRIRYLKEPIHPIAYMRKHLFHLPVDVNVAIAHNRLPSRGKVCYENTHPFISCNKEFAIVHNGHAFTHRWEAELRSNGHVIQGETDSELVMHKLEDLLNETGDMVEALMKLCETEFSGALLVLTREGEIYGVREGFFPIHFTRYRGEVYIASTAKALKALLGDNIEVYSLKQRQVLYVKNGKYELIGEGVEETYYPYHYYNQGY